MRAIITRDLYIYYPIFEVYFFVFKEFLFRKFCPYIWLVFKSDLQSRGGYDVACTVNEKLCISCQSTVTTRILQTGFIYTFLISLSSTSSTLEWLYLQIVGKSWDLSTICKYYRVSLQHVKHTKYGVSLWFLQPFSFDIAEKNYVPL